MTGELAPREYREHYTRPDRPKLALIPKGVEA